MWLLILSEWLQIMVYRIFALQFPHSPELTIKTARNLIRFKIVMIYAVI